MKTTAKGTGRAMSMPAGISVGTGLALIITMVLSLAAAWLVERGTMQQTSIGYSSMAILLLSSVCGTRIACGKIKRRYLMVCMVTGLCYFASLLGMTALFFGGQYSAVGVTGLLILAGAGTSFLLRGQGIRSGKKRRIRGRK